MCIASTHVDDLKLTGKDDTANWIITELEKEVGKSKTAVGEFDHCGIEYKQIEKGDILIHQNHCTARLHPLILPKECNSEG